MRFPVLQWRDICLNLVIVPSIPGMSSNRRFWSHRFTRGLEVKHVNICERMPSSCQSRQKKKQKLTRLWSSPLHEIPTRHIHFFGHVRWEFPQNVKMSRNDTLKLKHKQASVYILDICKLCMYTCVCMYIYICIYNMYIYIWGVNTYTLYVYLHITGVYA